MARPETKSGSRNFGGSTSNVLGASLRVRGRVNGLGDLTVLGSVEGDIAVSGDLAVDEGGTLVGNARARAVSIGGTLTGDVEADGEVTIRSGARVTGNMNGSQIALEEGASFTGRIDAAFDLPADMDGGAHEGSTSAGRGRAPSRGRR